MGENIPFFVKSIIFIGPPIIAAIWMTQSQNKFYRLLEKKNHKEYGTLQEESSTMNPFQQQRVINRINKAVNAHYKDVGLEIAAKNAQKAYYITIVAGIISATITFILVLLDK